MNKRSLQCLRCGAAVETDKHIFFESQEAKEVWHRIEGITVFKSGNHRSFKDWFAAQMENGEQKQTEFKAITMWLIWKSRNDGIFEGSERGAEQICNYGQLFLQDFQAAQLMRGASIGNQNQPSSDRKWKPPTENLLKLNVDAAFKDDRAGIGLIVRDSKGELEGVMTENISHCFDAEHAETMGFLRALQFAEEFGITHFELEGDALIVVNRINSTQEDLSMTGHLTSGIRSLVQEFPFAKITHVNRKLNKLVHEASRIALNAKGRNVWFTNFPQTVMNAVKLDSS